MKRNRNKHKNGTAVTINGTVVNGVALDRNGLPLLNDKMGFMTVGMNSGAVRDRSKK